MTTDQGTRTYPFSDAERLQLDPLYLKLQESEPVTRVRMPFGGEAWLVTGYREVKTVLADLRFSRAAMTNTDHPRTSPLIQSDRGILSTDPPDHGRLRKLAAKAFTARRVEELRVRAQKLVDGLLDEMEEQGAPGELVEGLAMPLPITVISDILGVPEDERRDFRRWSDTLLGYFAFTPDEMTAAFDNLTVYIAKLVEDRRREPTDDMLGVLVTARDDEDRLSEDELISFAMTLLVAGHETTANLIGNSIYTLLTHPEHLAEFKADPDVLPAAVEELARIIPLSSVVTLPRMVTEDVELGGVTIRAGDSVFVSLPAANRDPSVFEAAAELDFHRASNPHITFGHGIHHCLGAPLARMEMQIALGTLFRRFPGLEFTVPAEEVEFKKGRLVRGPAALPVRW